ncbi:MAG TPA: lysine--tRNA ligase, partial [Caulobacteraceae bacterium]
MLQGLTHLARQARPWTFAEARNLLARVLKTRLDTDAERDLAATLIEADKWDELTATFPALLRPVVFQCGYGASGLPHVGTFGEAARPTMVRSAFRALTNNAIPTKLVVFSDDMDGLRKVPPNLPHQDWLEADRDKPV